MATLDDLDEQPGVTPTPPRETQSYTFQQTMLRIKDPMASLDFYTRVLGMTLLSKLSFPERSFSLYFLGYAPAAARPADEADRIEWTFKQAATLELTHNWGTELDDGPVYHNGNEEPKGFGHIGIAVDDVYMACARFEELGVPFVKKPDDGAMKGIAFIKDPDGYWVEIVDARRMRQFAAPVDE